MRSVKKTEVGIFSTWNEQEIRALLYSHHKPVKKFSESCRKIFRKLIKCHSKPIFLKIKQKNITATISEIFGKFLENFRQTVGDFCLNKDPTILVPHYL